MERARNNFPIWTQQTGWESREFVEYCFTMSHEFPAPPPRVPCSELHKRGATLQCARLPRQIGKLFRARSYDAGKKIKGRKQHIAVDTLGLPWAIAVHSAGIQDRAGVKLLLLRLFGLLACTLTLFADAAYTGKLGEWVKTMFGWTLEVVHKVKGNTFHVLPKRWIVERSFSWLGHYRCLAKDYEINPINSEAMIAIASSRILLRRATG